MKRVMLVALLVTVLALLMVAPASAEMHCESGQAFGQHHAEMVQMGHLSGEMNPGMHHGYSACMDGMEQ